MATESYYPQRKVKLNETGINLVDKFIEIRRINSLRDFFKKHKGTQTEKGYQYKFIGFDEREKKNDFIITILPHAGGTQFSDIKFEYTDPETMQWETEFFEASSFSENIKLVLQRLKNIGVKSFQYQPSNVQS